MKVRSVEDSVGDSSARPSPVLYNIYINRRALLLSSIGLAFVPGVLAGDARAIPLAPLGRIEREDRKQTGLSPEQVKEILRKDLEEGQYFVTGNLTTTIFDDSCRFVDPTNDVTGLSRYVKALSLLFDPLYSSVKLLNIAVTGPRTIEADYMSGGFLRFPWSPKVEPYQGHVIYTLNEDGLVSVQRQTWDISPFEALRQSFTPSGTEPYKVVL